MPTRAFEWAILEKCGLLELVWFRSAATINWLTSTFQPSMKVVIEPATEIFLHFFDFASIASKCQPWLLSGQFWSSLGYLNGLQVQPPQNG